MIAKSENNISFTIDLKKNPKKEEAYDVYYLVYIQCFLLGLVHLLPMSFFTTATDYWMYKFRNTTTDIVDPYDRTYLQIEFAPSNLIALQTSSITFLILTLIFGHRIPLKFKLFIPLLGDLSLYILSALFIPINTDDWQMGFFVLTMLIVVGINGLGATFGMGIFSLIASFPKEYLGAYLTGQGLASVFTAVLQVLSLTIGMSTKLSALVYFWTGIAVIALTVTLLTLLTHYNHFYNYHIRNYQEVEKKMIEFKEFVEISKLIWPAIISMFLYLLVFLPLHPAITSLVISEYQGQGNDWNDTYFVPVITFLLSSICEYAGRIFSIKMKNKLKSEYLVSLAALRLAFIPLLILCNAQPRTHLPVVFPHDYQYIIILVIFTITNGYIMSSSNLLIPKLVPPDKVERAYHINLLTMGISMGSICYISFISVDLL